MSDDRDIIFDREREEEPEQPKRVEPRGESSSVRMYGKFTGDEWAAYGRGELVPGLNADYPPSPPKREEPEPLSLGEGRPSRRRDAAYRQMGRYEDEHIPAPEPIWRPILITFGLLLTVVSLSYGIFMSRSQRTVKVVPIRDVPIAQALPKVANPTGEFDTSLGVKIVPKDWRWLILKAAKEDGSIADVELLRPLWWLEVQSLVYHEELPGEYRDNPFDETQLVGRQVYVSVPECGIDGFADLLEIRPCPEILEGDDVQIVTGRFVHRNVTVIDVRIEGLDEPIGTTPNHPFFSEDRQAFIRADELKKGERLRTYNAAKPESHLSTSISPRGPPEELFPRVMSITQRPGTHTVYNLEVHLDHVYHVTANGILVHNSKACRVGHVPNPGGRLGNAATRAKTKEVIDDLRSRGFTEVTTEIRFRAGHLGSGKNRFVDVVGYNPVTRQTEIVQIGRTLKRDPRVPVIRERRALDDIIVSPDIKNHPRSTIRFVDVNRPGVIQP